MSLVSQGAFSLSSFPSVPGRRPRWSTAIPEGSLGMDPVQGCEVHAASWSGIRVTAPGSLPWDGLSSLGHSHPRVHPWAAPLHPHP